MGADCGHGITLQKIKSLPSVRMGGDPHVRRVSPLLGTNDDSGRTSNTVDGAGGCAAFRHRIRPVTAFAASADV